MSFVTIKLPQIHLDADGDVLKCEYPVNYPLQWSVHAERESECAARTVVKVDNCIVADITVHAANHILPSEVQDIACAIIWSRIRAIALKRGWSVDLDLDDAVERWKRLRDLVYEHWGVAL